MWCDVFLKKQRRKEVEAGLEKLSTTDEQYLKVKKWGKELMQDLSVASGLLVDPFTVHQSFIRKTLQEKADICEMTQELDWKSVATGLMEWCNPLKQRGIVLSENGTKGSQHPKNSFWIFFMKSGELFSKTVARNYKNVCLRGFTLCWRIYELLPHIDFQAHLNCTKSFCLIYCVFIYVCTYFLFFGYINKEMRARSRPLHMTVGMIDRSGKKW